MYGVLGNELFRSDSKLVAVVVAVEPLVTSEITLT